MKIISCLKCGKKLRIPDEKTGNFKCPTCKIIMSSDSNGNLSIHENDNKTSKISFRCLKCDTKLSVPIDKTIKFQCPKCFLRETDYYGHVNKYGFFSGNVQHKILQGNIISNESFTEGIHNGISKYFWENGELKTEVVYKNGKKDSLKKDYYENGEVEEEIYYKDGKIDGFNKTYYENGNLWYHKTYKNDKIVFADGHHFSYYPNGQVKEDNLYRNGKQDGVCKAYLEDGDICLITIFKDDNPIEKKGWEHYDDENDNYWVRKFYNSNNDIIRTEIYTDESESTKVGFTNSKRAYCFHGHCQLPIVRRGRNGIKLFEEAIYINGHFDEQIRIVDEFGRTVE